MKANRIFEIFDYCILSHKDHQYTISTNDKLESLLCEKCKIDCLQWDKEDKVREAYDKDLSKVNDLKKEIDKLNRKRTQLVEEIDQFLFDNLEVDDSLQNINSETLGWMIDRMSILSLKIYHMSEKLHLIGIDKYETSKKLSILLSQRGDLAYCFDTLVSNIKKGQAGYKLYKQMKMYK